MSALSWAGSGGLQERAEDFDSLGESLAQHRAHRRAQAF